MLFEKIREIEVFLVEGKILGKIFLEKWKNVNMVWVNIILGLYIFFFMNYVKLLWVCKWEVWYDYIYVVKRKYMLCYGEGIRLN